MTEMVILSPHGWAKYRHLCIDKCTSPGAATAQHHHLAEVTHISVESDSKIYFRNNRAQLRAIPAVRRHRGLKRPDPAVAVPPRAALPAGPPPGHHRVGGRPRRVPSGGAGRGGQDVGRQEVQGKHELRQAQPRAQVRNLFLLSWMSCMQH